MASTRPSWWLPTRAEAAHEPASYGLYARVVVEVTARALNRPFTYGIPDALHGEVQVGSTVEVPFGPRCLVGFVLEIVADPDPEASSHRLRPILRVLDPTPFWGQDLLHLADWMRRFYGCTWLEALQTAIPGPVLRRARAARTATRGSRPRALPCVEPVQAYPEIAPNHAQQLALEVIREARATGGTVLLHGVTGSGKTEVYLRAVREVLDEGRQAVVLVPELALTPQAVERYRGRLGGTVGVLHSGLADPERREQWWSLRRGELNVALGTRSAVFAPLDRPGLFVVDEEHETSYKQEGAPRYHARQVAFQRAARHGAAVVLGSATPSLESYHLARQGRFRLIELPGRPGGRPLPTVRIVDMRRHLRKGRLLSPELGEALRDRIAQDEQVVLLLNRRGFASFLQCQECGFVPTCPECSISLTWHRARGLVRCHYCLHQEPPPETCPACQGHRFRTGGAGTERLEAEVQELVPGVPVVRMDSDTTAGTGAHRRLLERFGSGQARVLVGTRMIAKGLDFPSVTLVGVVRADAELHMPDFRAAERTFQLLAQVAGRAGRGDRPGEVLLQAMDPEHPCLVAAATHDYAAMSRSELDIRREAGYPPFCRLVRLLVSHPDPDRVEAEATRIGSLLSARLRHARVVGPAPCPVERVRGRHRWHLLLKGSKVQELMDGVRNYLRPPEGPDLQILADPDPQSLM